MRKHICYVEDGGKRKVAPFTHEAKKMDRKKGALHFAFLPVEKKGLIDGNQLDREEGRRNRD